MNQIQSALLYLALPAIPSCFDWSRFAGDIQSDSHNSDYIARTSVSADSPRYWRRESPPYSNRGRHVLPTGCHSPSAHDPVHHAHGPLLAHVTSAGPSRALRWLGVTSVSPSVTAHRPAAFELVPTARASERHRSGPAE